MSNTKTIRPVDLTYLTWSLSRSSIGTAGSFLKSYEEINGRILQMHCRWNTCIMILYTVW